MLSSTAFVEDEEHQQDNHEIATPLLERNHQFNIDGDASAAAAAAAADSGSMDPRLVVRHPVLRTLAMRCATMSSAADALPTIFYSIVTEGKMTAMFTVGAYLIFVALWIPFWLLSYVVTEWGVYALAVATVFGIGRYVTHLCLCAH